MRTSKHWLGAIALGTIILSAPPARASNAEPKPKPAMGMALEREALSPNTALGLSAVIVVLAAAMLLRRSSISD
jgi:hypothetical protein